MGVTVVVVVGATVVAVGATVVKGVVERQVTTPFDELTGAQCAEPVAQPTDHDCPGRSVVPLDVADAVATAAESVTAIIPATTTPGRLRRRSSILGVRPPRAERVL